jgi:GNAT superfamily N-acetyltransferase
LAALADSPDAFSSTLEGENAFPDETWRDRTRDSVAGIKSFCAVALDDDSEVGIVVGLSDANDATRCHLVSMWVAPSFRGTDVARSLVEAVAGWAKQRSASLLLAGVMPCNERALAFYKKVGFEPHTGPRPDHPATNTCNNLIVRRV